MPPKFSWAQVLDALRCTCAALPAHAPTRLDLPVQYWAFAKLSFV
jgi:hypothetical protein